MKPCSRLMLARFPWTTHNLESISVWQDIQYINHMANRWFWKHTRQATHALEVLVGVVLVNVHLFLIYSMNFTMTYYNGPFSHLLVNWMLKILGLAQMRRQYFHQLEPRLLPSFFPPMRSELTKLNKSAHTQSRILSPLWTIFGRLWLLHILLGCK